MGCTKTRSKEDIKEYRRQYRLAHKKERKAYDRAKYIENKEYFEEKNANYYLEHKEERIEYAKQWIDNNRDKFRKRVREYIKCKRQDTGFNLRSQISKNICRMLKSRGSSKNGKTCLNFLPYTMDMLKEHIEKQFKNPGNEWMNWDNWGIYNPKIWDDGDPSTWTWQIDHIMPQSKLLYSSMDDDNFKKCWALENLRPLSAKQNIFDGNRR